MQRFINQLLPFLFVGIAIAAFAFGIVLLAYLFLFGALVGVALFIISWIRYKFFPPKMPEKRKKSGRVIDSDDWKSL